MTALKILLALAAVGSSDCFVPAVLKSNRLSSRSVLSEPQSDEIVEEAASASMPKNDWVAKTFQSSDPPSVELKAKDQEDAAPGSFEYVGSLPSKGKIVITYEPDTKIPETPQPSQPTMPEANADALPGVHLPKDEIPERIPQGPQNPVSERIKLFAGAVLMNPKFKDLNRTPKSNGLGFFQESFSNAVLKKGTIPSPDFKPFGNGDNAKTLTYLLKTDPLFASALTKTKNGYELRAFDKKDPACNDSPTLYRQITSTLTGAGHRVNFFFDKKMEITHFKVYDDVIGKKIFSGQVNDLVDSGVDMWASSALYNTFFYAQSIHATLHVLHYLMTSAFQYVSSDFEEMHQWAKMYAYNVPNKYDEVRSLLLREPPVPRSLADPTSQIVNQAVNWEKLHAAISGRGGFGATEERIRPILTELLNKWGQCTSADDWLGVMIDSSITPEDMKKAGILTQFKKHKDIIPLFATEVKDAFQKINADKTTIAELKLKDYLKRCGSFTSKIDTLESWIELISVTGDVHGGTLGFTRLGAMSDVMRWRNIKDTNWEASDLDMIFTLLATATGSEDGRHTMNSSIDAPFHHELQVVLDKFDAEVTNFKETYEQEIQKDEDFNNFGWILAVYCTDGFDGKQLTAATYI